MVLVPDECVQPLVQRVGGGAVADVVDVDGPVAPQQGGRQGHADEVAGAQPEAVQGGEEFLEAVGIGVVVARRGAESGAGRDQHAVGLGKPGADRVGLGLKGVGLLAHRVVDPSVRASR